MLDTTLSKKDIQIEKKSTVCKYVVPEGYGVKSMVGETIDVNEEAIRKPVRCSSTHPSTRKIIIS